MKPPSDAFTEKIFTEKVETFVPPREQPPAEEKTFFVCGPNPAEPTDADYQPTRNLRPQDAAIARVNLQAPPQVAGYEILEELGRGGMGVVYKAWQYSLQRTVALKMILTGSFASAHEVERFRTEAMAIARLHHPNLLSIFEIGHQDGLPYYAMEYMDGGSLARRLNGQPQPTAQAARLILTLAQAMDYAHKQGVVHRDLKPANILCQSPDGLIVKITDFGLAKQMNQDGCLTKTGDILGTPSYMAPEQANGRTDLVGPATDIYSLGTLLYELLTGHLVFQGANGVETMMLVANAEPLPPRKWVRSVPPDLETICLKCLEKDPAKRYASAGHLADDLTRFLQGEPIRARPASLAKRVVKWARRRPDLAVLGVASFLVLLLSFGLITSLWQKASIEAEAEKEASLAKAKALLDVEHLLAGALLDRGIQQADRGDVRRGMHLMVKALELATKVEKMEGRSNPLVQAARLNLAGWSHHVFPQSVPLIHQGWAWAVAYSPDGRFVVTGGKDQKAQVWDTVSGKPVGMPLAHPDPVWGVAYHPAGKTIITVSGNVTGGSGQIRVWRQSLKYPGTFHLSGEPLANNASFSKIVISPRGDSFLAVSNDGMAQLYSYSDAEEGNGCMPIGPPLRHMHLIKAAAYTPDGRLVFTASYDRTVRRWHSASGLPAGPPFIHSGPVESLAVSPDGRLLLTGSGVGDKFANGRFSIYHPGEARLWHLDTGQALAAPLPHPGLVKAVAFAPDGRTIATSCAFFNTKEQRLDGDARLWDLKAGDEVLERGQPLTHPLPVWALAFSPDSRFLLTGCEDGYSRLWNAATGQLISTPLGHEGNVVAVAFSPSGSTAITASAGGSGHAAARLWEIPVPQTTFFPLVHGRAVKGLVWEKSGRFVWSTGDDGRLRRWNVTDGTLSKDVDSQGRVGALFLTPDERQLFGVRGGGGGLMQWDVASDQILKEHKAFHTENPTRAFLHPSGSSFLIGSESPGHFELRSTEDGKPLTRRLQLEHHLVGLILSPDGTRSVSSKIQRPLGKCTIQMRDLQTGKEQLSWEHGSLINALAFSPDGTYLATGGADRQVQFWNTTTGRMHGTPLLHDHQISGITFSPNGSVVASACEDGAARLWHMASGRQIGSPLRHSGHIYALAFRPDGKVLLTGSLDRSAVFWKVPEPVEGSLERVRLWIESLTGMEMKDNDVVLPLELEQLHERRARLNALGGVPYPKKGIAN